MTHGTPSDDQITGGYIQFQTEVLRQLPRPEEISRQDRERWMSSRSALGTTLRTALDISHSGKELFEDHGVVATVEGIRNFDMSTRLSQYRGKIRHLLEPLDYPLWRSSHERNVRGKLHRLDAKRACTPIEAFTALRPDEGCFWSDVFEILEPQIDGGRGILTTALERPNYFLVQGRNELLFVKLWRFHEDNRLWALQKVQFGSPEDIEQGSRIFTRR